MLVPMDTFCWSRDTPGKQADFPSGPPTGVRSCLQRGGWYLPLVYSGFPLVAGMSFGLVRLDRIPARWVVM